MMLDIETLDTSTSAVIISLAAVTFNCSKVLDQFIVNIDLDESMKKGRTTSASTLRFWIKNTDLLQDLLENSQGIEEALSKFNFWVTTNHPIDEVWANAPSFDCIILQEYYRLFNRNLPWSFRKQRDVRTLKGVAMDMEVKLPPRNPALVLHDPLHDCIYQAEQVISIKQQIRKLKNGN